MRVLAVTNMFPTNSEPWFGCFVREQIEDLRALGHDVEVLSFDGRRRRLNYAIGAKAVRRYARKGFDLVHAHYGLSGAVALAQGASPVVTTFWGSDTGYIRWQAYLGRVVARLSTPIFVSARGASAMGRPDACVIPSAVDTDLFRPRSSLASRRALGWRAQGVYILLPGSLRNRVKGPELFAAAVRETQRAVPDATPVSLEALSREQVALVMSAVDVTLMTSVAEGSPIAVKESLACATPVVSVDVGDVADVIADAPGCAVVARDTSALAEAVVRALRYKGDAGIRQRAERFSRAAIARRIDEVYRSVVT